MSGRKSEGLTGCLLLTTTQMLEGSVVERAVLSKCASGATATVTGGEALTTAASTAKIQPTKEAPTPA